MGALLVGVVSALIFGWDLPSEPSFVDEWAYLSQTYYADLWLAGAGDHPAWLEYPAYDLPPLPKYAFGLALRLGGYSRPGPDAARRWYADTRSECGPRSMLMAARWPTVLFGSLGCVALYGLGVLCGGRRVGLLAALLLALNPLYRLHARRAMSDVLAESLILIALGAGLFAWSRILAGRHSLAAWLAAAVAGVAAGMAALAKLNGALAMMVLIAWSVLAIVLPRVSWRRKLLVPATVACSGVLSLLTFTAWNPVLTAHPRTPLPTESAALARMNTPQRMMFLARFRYSVSEGQKSGHPHNALRTLPDKLGVLVAQGFGRFSPMGPAHTDSTVRYDPAQDWGLVIWLPLVIWGAWQMVTRGRLQFQMDEPPTAWAALEYAALSWVVVAAYIPLAWDRYLLSIQPGSSLLAATAIADAARRLRARFAGTRGGH